AFAALPGVSVPARCNFSNHVFHQYTLRVPAQKRDALKQHLEAAGVPAMVYYPVPCHLQNAYRNGCFPEGSLPVTEQLCKEVISLPMSTEIDAEQEAKITASVAAFFNP